MVHITEVSQGAPLRAKRGKVGADSTVFLSRGLGKSKRSSASASRNPLRIWRASQSTLPAVQKGFRTYCRAFQLARLRRNGSSSFPAEGWTSRPASAVKSALLARQAAVATHAGEMTKRSGKIFSMVHLVPKGARLKGFERIKVTFGQQPVKREGTTETGMNFSNPLANTVHPGQPST